LLFTEGDVLERGEKKWKEREMGGEGNER